MSSPSPPLMVSSRLKPAKYSLEAVPVSVSLLFVPLLSVKIPLENVIASTFVTVSVPSGELPRKSTIVNPLAFHVRE